METLKLLAFVTLMLLFMQCSSKIEKLDPEGLGSDSAVVLECKEIQALPVDTVFTEYVTSVEKFYHLYFIKAPRTTKISGFLAPCSFSDEFKIDGLKVKISGQVPRVVINPDRPVNVFANGINLTSIEKAE